MAYETGTTTGIDDLMTKLDTFVTANGWTRENTDLSYDWVTFSRSNCYVSFKWDSTVDHSLAVYQSTGYGSLDTEAPHLNTGDSGNGTISGSPTTERRVNFTDGAGNTENGPYVAYHFFEDDTTVPYVYVVVETATGVFRHFGFGTLIKVNDWTGGEFAFGHYWGQTDATIDNVNSTLHHYLLDGLAASNAEAATVRIEGMPGQDVDSEWGVCFWGTKATAGTDTAGEERLPLLGGSRTGLYGRTMSWMQSSQLAAYKPLMPIGVIYRDTTTSPDTWYWLGEMPDIALINMSYFSGGDTLDVGGQDWLVFPCVRNVTVTDNTESSRNAGVAIKKVT